MSQEVSCSYLIGIDSSWKWNASITPSRSNDLVPRGFMDLKGIGMRLKNKFPELVNDSCGGPDYYVSGKVFLKLECDFLCLLSFRTRFRIERGRVLNHLLKEFFMMNAVWRVSNQMMSSKSI